MSDQLAQTSPPILQMRSITKFYGENRVLNNVPFTLQRGEIHALLGENGAGKTTLMNILRGLTTPTSGEVLIDGNVANIKTPLDSSRFGIGMVHQHFLLIPAFTVLENLILAGQQNGILLDKERITTQATKICDQLRWNIPFSAKVADLTVGIQQRVEILKALLGDSKIVLFDEPTAVLTPNEVSELLDVLRKLKSEGRALVFVSHKLHEVMAVCDRVTVLRRGDFAGEVSIEETSPYDLARRMVGDEATNLLSEAISNSSPKDSVGIQVSNLTSPRLGVDDVLIENMNFQVASGEILGFAGVDGNGQEELFDVLSGVRAISQGTLKIGGKSVNRMTPSSLGALQISLIPPDRPRQGLALTLSIRDNLLLDDFQNSRYQAFGLISNRLLDQQAERLREDFDVRTPDISLPASSLSGGNQQKIVIARALSQKPKVVIAASPTRGLDVAATVYVHDKLRGCRDAGAAIVLISTDLDEIIALSDRIAILYQGRIIATVSPTTPREKLGLAMGGKTISNNDKPAREQ
jgi:general nucleoside transport system ATP-binding protein